MRSRHLRTPPHLSRCAACGEPLPSPRTHLLRRASLLPCADIMVRGGWRPGEQTQSMFDVGKGVASLGAVDCTEGVSLRGREREEKERNGMTGQPQRHVSLPGICQPSVGRHGLA